VVQQGLDVGCDLIDLYRVGGDVWRVSMAYLAKGDAHLYLEDGLVVRW
jgi:hypothetical protein